MLSSNDQAYWTQKIRNYSPVQSMLAAQGLQPEVSSDQRKKDSVVAVDFYPWLKDLTDRLLKRQASMWKANYNLWIKNALYFLSLQNLSRNGSGFGYKYSGKDHKLYPTNIFRPQAEEAIASYFGSMPQVKFMALEVEERRSQHVTREVETLHDHLMFQYYTEEMKMRTLMDGLITGNRTFETWYDEDCQDGVHWEQQFHEINNPESFKVSCYGCGYSYNSEQPDERCQQCGTSSIKLEKQEAENYKIPGDNVLARTGDVTFKDWSPLSLRYDLTTGPADSPFLYIYEDVPREEFEMWADEKVEDTASSETWAQDENMIPVRMIRRAEADRNAMGYSAPGEFNEILRQRFLLRQPLYHFFKSNTPVKLPNGEEIPAGVRFSEYFTEGMDMITVPGATKFYKIDNRDHQKHFIHGKHMHAPGRADGIGNRDGSRANFHENILRSGMTRYLQKTLQPSILASQQMFPNRNFWNQVDNVVGFSSAQLGDKHLSDHIAPLVPPPLSPHIAAMVEKLADDSRESFKAYTSESDGFRQPNPTARAVSASQERRAAGHGMNMLLYAGTYKELSVRALELCQENYDTLRLIGKRDELTNTWRSKQLKAEDIKCGLVAYVVAGSAEPDFSQQKRQKFADAIELAGSLNALGLLNPQSLQQVNQICGVDLSFSDQFQHIEQLERAYQAMKEIDTQTNGSTPAEMLNQIMPVKQNAPDLDLHRNWWSRLLGSNEGQSLSPELERAINLRIEAYDLAQAANLQRQQMLMPQPPQPTPDKPIDKQEK